MTPSGQPVIDPRLAPPAPPHASAPPQQHPTLHQRPYPPPQLQQQQHRPPYQQLHQPQQSTPQPLRQAYPGAPQPTSQPYYQYPAPPSSHNTPQHHSTGTVTASGSNQTTPRDAGYSPPEQADTSPGEHGDSENAAEDAKRPRACEACRGLKVRCDQDPLRPDIACKRCAKAGRHCVITQPSRKRQKKADNRVAELEKKLDALTAVLHQHGNSSQHAMLQQSTATIPPAEVQARAGVDAAYPPASASPAMPRPASNEPSMQPPQKRRRIEDTSTTPHDESAPPQEAPQSTKSAQEVRDEMRSIYDAWGPGAAGLKGYLNPNASPVDFVNRINTLVIPAMASTVFDRYVTKLMPHLPAVIFPAGTTAEQVWKEKPILYVCVLSASSLGVLSSDLTKQLATEAVGAIADSVVRNGAKSLELIQAMQVMAFWYKPPERAEQTNFYQIIHMAAVMALDIGLGQRFNPIKARRGFGGPNANFAPGPTLALPQDSDTLEARRAWLSCYYLCASASMVLRRPNLIRWTNYMKECIEVLESHPDAYASDKLFCQHVKIQHICEDIGLQFLMDDTTATVSITDPKVSYQLNVLENDLKKWKENIPPECRGPQLQFFEHVTSLYLHEIALHFNHNVEDFRLPFTEESLKSVTNTSDTLTQNQTAALEACFKAAHGILDTMLSFELQIIKTLPMLIFFVRCTYAIVILIKMHVASSTPGSELGKIIKAEDLRVDHYLDSLMSMFAFVAKDEEFRPHPKILRILAVLKDWFGHHKANVASRAPNASTRNPSAEPAQGDRKQNPLHLLSQLATGKQPATEGHQEWTFNSPYTFNHAQAPPPGHPDNRFPVYQQQQGAGVYSDTQGGAAEPGVDPTNPEVYGWGSGFEQAMDMAMGGVDGLSGGGLDGWFLGDSMAPFAFNGDVQGQWQ